MISANASWIFHSNPKLATYHWTSAGCEITNEDGSFSFKNPHQNFVQFSIDKQAHPKRHVIYALISMILFFPTGKVLEHFIMLRNLGNVKLMVNMNEH
ncbi:unnamed protein product [Adineta ricciae]|uniref:Uncharacterized protein n=1 Tax=Adineta ricciae TaxID=249248 RepID=A0A814H338_ADIRI|nr:unnamed protein product [Adineta ricciae]